MQKLRKHPDLGGDEWDAGIINEAYAVLSDEKSRREYDATLFTERSRADTGNQGADQRREGRKRKQQADEKQQRREQQEQQEQGEQAQQEDSAQAANDEAQTQHKEPHANKQRHSERSVNCCAFCTRPFVGQVNADCVYCNSPLLRITPEKLENSCQRDIQRFPRNTAISFRNSWPGEEYAGVLNDVSLNGVQFKSAQSLTDRDYIRIECSMFVAVAKIVNSRQALQGAYSYGAQFVSIRFARQSGSFVATSV